MTDEEPLWGEELAQFGPVSIHRMGERMTKGYAPERPDFLMVTGQAIGAARIFLTMIPMQYSSLPDLLGKLEEQFVFATREFTRDQKDLLTYTVEYLAQQPPERVAAIQRFQQHIYPKHERKYRAFQQVLQEFRDHYPHMKSEQGLVRFYPPPVPPSPVQLWQYILGTSPFPDLLLSHWGELGPILQRYGPFVVRPISRLRYGEWSADAYLALQCETSSEEVDVGILGKEEHSDMGIRQRIRLCLEAFETNLYTEERTIAIAQESEPQQPMHERLNIIERRYTIIRDTFDEWTHA